MWCVLLFDEQGHCIVLRTVPVTLSLLSSEGKDSLDGGEDLTSYASSSWVQLLLTTWKYGSKL